MSALQGVMNKFNTIRFSCRYPSVSCISTGVPIDGKINLDKDRLRPKPKKPPSPFLRFLTQIRPNLVQQNPNQRVTDISKLAALEWKNVDEKMKNKLQEEYRADYTKYQLDVKEYEKSLSPGDKEEIKQAKFNAKVVKERRQLKKKKIDMGCPKKPASSFLKFMSAKAAERGQTSFKEWQSKISKMWEVIPEAEKQKYSDLYKKEMESYKKKRDEWEEEMKKSGNLDVEYSSNKTPIALSKTPSESSLVDSVEEKQNNNALKKKVYIFYAAIFGLPLSLVVFLYFDLLNVV